MPRLYLPRPATVGVDGGPKGVALIDTPGEAQQDSIFFTVNREKGCGGHAQGVSIRLNPFAPKGYPPGGYRLSGLTLKSGSARHRGYLTGV